MISIDINERLERIETLLNKQQMTPPRTHIKTKDACGYMSVSPNTLNKICIENNIYPVKIAGCNYYKISDLEKLFDEARVN